jgi:hypothetical protein
MYYREGPFGDILGQFGGAPRSAKTTEFPWFSYILRGCRKTGLLSFQTEAENSNPPWRRLAGIKDRSNMDFLYEK